MGVRLYAGLAREFPLEKGTTNWVLTLYKSMVTLCNACCISSWDFVKRVHLVLTININCLHNQSTEFCNGDAISSLFKLRTSVYGIIILHIWALLYCVADWFKLQQTQVTAVASFLGIPE
jgi:hypothetical protein